MNQPAFADTADFYRIDASLKLDPKQRSELGQFMTPAPIARFMASLFSDVSGEVRLLDPGAGVGSLNKRYDNPLLGKRGGSRDRMVQWASAVYECTDEHLK